MAKVTYTDLERAAPYVKFHEIEFTHGLPVEVPDDRKEMLDLLAQNPFFKVERNGETESEPSSEQQASSPSETIGETAERLAEARRRGGEAWTEGRDRRAPPRWQTSALGQAWLEGYDDAARH